MINQDYLYSELYSNIQEFKPANNSTIYYCHSTEERSYVIDHLIATMGNEITFVELIEVDNEKVIDKADSGEYFLKSSKSIRSLLEKYSSKTVYFDVSGMDNRICASLLNNSLSPKFKDSTDFRILYVEPDSYDIKQFKTEGYFNDLSEKIDGIFPLPGFAKIFPSEIEKTMLVALLGFEGGRFSHILENIQLHEENIIPVIGVPGFRPEYPYFALAGNRRPLETSETWRKMKFAAANSMVDVYIMLNKLLRKKPDWNIKLAPIGTKPHAIGAMLFAIKNPDSVELIYDNPKRKKQRTFGKGKIVECFIGKLLHEN